MMYMNMIVASDTVRLELADDSKTPGIVSYVDDKIKPQLYAKISPFVAHRLDY